MNTTMLAIASVLFATGCMGKVEIGTLPGAVSSGDSGGPTASGDGGVSTSETSTSEAGSVCGALPEATVKRYASESDPISRLSGTWRLCSKTGSAGALGFGLVYDAIEFTPSGGVVPLKVNADGSTTAVSTGGAMTYTLIDTSSMNGAGAYQVDVVLGDGTNILHVSVDAGGQHLQLVNGMIGTDDLLSIAKPSACWLSHPNVPKATGPSGRSAGCSLAGTWAYEVTFSNPGQPKMVWSFDDEGRSVGGPAGTNLCKEFPWYGNYTLKGNKFAAVNIRGSGAPACGWSDKTTFDVEFSADCKTMTLPKINTDNCTGGALFYVGQMKRME